jgi:uncharacterized protein YqgV (UPF0045/DUF77 family)
MPSSFYGLKYVNEPAETMIEQIILRRLLKEIRVLENAIKIRGI